MALTGLQTLQERIDRPGLITTGFMRGDKLELWHLGFLGGQ